MFFEKFAFYGLDTYGARTGTGIGTVICQKSELEPYKIVTVPQHCNGPRYHLPYSYFPLHLPYSDSPLPFPYSDSPLHLPNSNSPIHLSDSDFLHNLPDSNSLLHLTNSNSPIHLSDSAFPLITTKKLKCLIGVSSINFLLKVYST